MEFTAEAISSFFSHAIVIIGALIRTARFSHDFPTVCIQSHVRSVSLCDRSENKKRAQLRYEMLVDAVDNRQNQPRRLLALLESLGLAAGGMASQPPDGHARRMIGRQSHGAGVVALSWW